MGKRTIQECDLCKQEYDPDDTYNLTFKPPGKKAGNKYDLCPQCAEKLQQQLVASSEAVLENWVFGSPSMKILSKDEMREMDAPLPPEPDAASRRVELADGDDDQFVLGKKREIEAREAETQEQTRNSKVPGFVEKPAGNKCPHYNKSPIMAGQTSDGSKTFFQKCRDCGKKLTPPSAQDRHTVATSKPPKGVNLRDL